jgi:predicted ATPase
MTATADTNGARAQRGRRRDGAESLTLFTHITLENWRNFTHVDVDLQQRVFLVGPNASGKSNFLDALRFLQDVVSVGGGFQFAVGKRGGVSRLRCLAARRYPDIMIRVQLGGEPGKAAWDYELRFTQDNNRRPVIQRERVVHLGKELLNRPDDKDQADKERLTQTYLEQVHANREFRVVGEFFQQIRYLHIVPQLVREPDRSVGRSNDPYGGDFLEQIAGTPDRIRTSRLARMQEALRVAVPQLRELTLQRDRRGTPHLQGRFEHWRPQGATLTEDQLSDGTLRLMGLLWALLDGSGPLLLEEPELSLHPDVVRYVPQMFARVQRRAGRQLLVSTHSPDLLRDEGIGLDEVLLLQPRGEGTQIHLAQDFEEVRDLLEGGLSMADAVLPLTRPALASQLALFGNDP